MSAQTTNPAGESTGTLEEAAAAFDRILNPTDSKEQTEETEEENSEQVEEAEEETEASDEDSKEQPEAGEEETSEEGEDDPEFEIGGEPVKASQLLEWKEQGLRQADYTKKTQELAQMKRDWEAQKEQEAAAFRKDWEQRLASVADQAIDELKQFESMNWDELQKNDPYAFNNQWIQYQRAKERAVVSQRQIQAAIQETQEKFQKERQETLQREFEEARKLIPVLADEKKAPEVLGKMTSYLTQVGMSKDEIESISSAKAWKVIYDAMQYKELSSKATSAGKKKIVPITKVIKPGSTASKATAVERDSKQREAKRERLRQTGSLRDAAEVFKDFI